MITCNHCKKANPDTSKNCQECGAPLPPFVGGDENGFVFKKNTQDQPELPAWLQSLRTGERPNNPPTSPSSFAADLVDEGKLPGWMQPDRGDTEISRDHPSLRPSSFSAPNTDESYIQGKNIPANSLIDEQFLPSWMQPESAPQRNIDASSLVQPEFVPDWMKAQVPGQPSAPVPQADQAVQQPSPPLPPQSFSARDLVDPQALPEWMRQQNGDVSSSMSTPSAESNPALYNKQPGATASGGAMEQTSLSAASFVDMNALPDWLRSAGDASQFSSQQGQMGASGYQSRQAGPQSMGGYGGHVDSVRVPSRPRGELGPNEGNEVAANVFASMLGVASNAPQFPGQPANQQGYQNPAPIGPGQAPTIQSSPAYATGQPGQQGTAYSGGNLAGQSNYAMSSSSMQNQQGPQSQSYSQSSGVSHMSPGTNRQGDEKPTKRGGLFEAIRNFFFRQS